MKIERVAAMIWCLVILLLFCGCREQEKTYEPSGKVVKIGFVGPLSGSDGSLGRNSLAGVKAALRLQPILLGGDRPEIVAADDGNDLKTAQMAVKKLVEEDGVSAILLSSTNSIALGLTERIEQYKIPCIALFATHPDISSGEYTSQLSFDDTLQGTVAALYVIDEMIIETVSIFVEPSDSHSKILAETFARIFVEAGGKAEIIPFPPGEVELEKKVRASQERGDELLYLPIHAAGVVQIEKISRKLDYNPGVMLSDGLLSRIVLKYASDHSLLEGMMATDLYSNVLLTEGYAEKLAGTFDGSFTEPKTTFLALGAEGMSILLGAMERCGDSRDSKCVNNNIRSTDNFHGVNSKISINSQGKAERPIFINTIVNKELQYKVIVY